MSYSINLDNAATTRLDAEVLASLIPYWTDFFGNPSSLLLNLDLQGICVSGGRSCSSGSGGSHVINALGILNECTPIRFSFSKYNTKQQINQVVEVLKSVLNTKEAMAV
ncbi:MAG TPA: hypothetical protein VNS32_07410 [Flavisolibacter sp.]|nr:hypothetical protein [Flavisolibacter sp.]